MKKYRKKPIIVEAVQWFCNGDHPEDNCDIIQTITQNGEHIEYLGEGKVVRYFRSPEQNERLPCANCGKVMHDHGWIDTLEGERIVCPGDYIITGINNEKYPCKPDIFEENYEKVENE